MYMIVPITIIASICFLVVALILILIYKIGIVHQHDTMGYSVENNKKDEMQQHTEFIKKQNTVSSNRAAVEFQTTTNFKESSGDSKQTIMQTSPNNNIAEQMIIEATCIQNTSYTGGNI